MFELVLFFLSPNNPKREREQSVIYKTTSTACRNYNIIIVRTYVYVCKAFLAVLSKIIHQQPHSRFKNEGLSIQSSSVVIPLTSTTAPSAVEVCSMFLTHTAL